MIRVVVKRPGVRWATVETIEHAGLEPLQALVGEGSPERTNWFETGMKAHNFFGRGGHLVAYVNEDGLRLKLLPNLHRPSDGWLLVGTIVAVKVDEQGETISMTEDEAAKVRDLLGTMKEAELVH